MELTEHQKYLKELLEKLHETGEEFFNAAQRDKDGQELLLGKAFYHKLKDNFHELEKKMTKLNSTPPKIV